MPPTSNPSESSALTILGGGVWGLALASLGRVKAHRVNVWSRRGDLSLEEATAQAPVIVMAISMKGVQDVATHLKAVGIAPETILVSATKGLDPITWQTPSQIWHATFPENPMVVLSGPNLSKEIDQGLPTATVVASEDVAAAATLFKTYLLQKAFACIPTPIAWAQS